MFIRTSFFRRAVVRAAVIASAVHARAVMAQTKPDPMKGMSMPMSDSMSHSMSSSTDMAMFSPLGVSMNRMGSGTTWVPDAAPIPSLHTMAGAWDLTMHGFVFVQENSQGGERGASQFGSLNWGMFMASREVAGGRFQARTMLSLDPLTVTPRGYPLLLQTGESYHGDPLHDRQHPHDFFMELGALYERPVTKTLGVSLYAAPSGEPALGPVAFMHRPSAMDIPVAPITHHWQDATHITFGVVSAGIFSHDWKLEGSAFNGREPDEYRWNIDRMRLDSYSGRLTVNPNAHWSFTGGYGFIHSPDELHPDESEHRVTASALYGAPLGPDGQWSSAVIWGANKAIGEDFSHSGLAELEVVAKANTFIGRAEWAQKSGEDLVLDGPGSRFSASQVFDVGLLSLGYIREIRWVGSGSIGLGATGTVNVVPKTLEPTYGSRTPLAAMVFLRLRPAMRSRAEAGGGMSMDR